MLVGAGLKQLPLHLSASKIGYWRAAGAVAAVSALAYDATPDLPLAPQSDEPKKADFILEGR